MQIHELKELLIQESKDRDDVKAEVMIQRKQICKKDEIQRDE